MVMVFWVSSSDPMNGLSDGVPSREVQAWVEASVESSLRALKKDTLDVLLLHRWEHRHANDGVIWKRLVQLKQAGKIRALGASVQNPEELKQAAHDSEVQYAQFPYNVLDGRWATGLNQIRSKSRKDWVLHARSVYLQGALLRPWNEVRHALGAGDGEKYWSKLTHFVKRFDRESVQDLCLAYARAESLIDSLVIGVESLEQCEENIRLFHKTPLTPSQSLELRESVGAVPSQLTHPTLWNKEVKK
jgi:aryl-alcohol dehydrogenase-like predicted oxidoreductase